MDQKSVVSTLADLNLPAIHFFNTIDSTNAEAWRWLENGAPHGAMVIADEQTAGKGRLHRRWITAVGSGLAFSLVLMSPPFDSRLLSRLTGLGALATCLALQNHYSLPAQVKWPNDILLDQRKAGGVLVEARWNGKDLQSVVIGIGINIAPESVNPDLLPAEALSFPATCIENALGHPVDRMELLHAILHEFVSWLPQLGLPDFIETWESHLAYRDQWVELSGEAHAISSPHQDIPALLVTGKVIGLSEDGALQLLTRSGKVETAQVGEIHLRPAASSPSG